MIERLRQWRERQGGLNYSEAARAIELEGGGAAWRKYELGHLPPSRKRMLFFWQKTGHFIEPNHWFPELALAARRRAA